MIFEVSLAGFQLVGKIALHFVRQNNASPTYFFFTLTRPWLTSDFHDYFLQPGKLANQPVGDERMLNRVKQIEQKIGNFQSFATKAITVVRQLLQASTAISITLHRFLVFLR